MKNKSRVIVPVTSLFLVLTCCSDDHSSVGIVPDSTRSISVDVGVPQDVGIIQVIQDAYVDPCENISSSNEIFCDCMPQCCQVQMWYCPPSGLQVNAAEIVMNICDENFEVCDRAADFSCPPNQVLSQGDCRGVLECPPSLESDLTITVQCEIEGQQGTQEILCTKGNIQYGECVVCNPAEERCNYKDDDCDGEVDEDQKNACGSCGPVSSDVCNGQDDDCDGRVDEGLVRECQTACERGIETCLNGAYRSCTAVQPEDEICDGTDNDCDGKVDEQLECLCTIQDVGNLQPCSEPPLLCGQGFKTCECVDPGCNELRMTQCAAICEYIPIGAPELCDPRLGLAVQQEECNSFDEDCDEEIDEDLTQQCYTGNPDTLFVGVCTPGEVYCKLGVWGSDRDDEFQPGLCAGEVLPRREICDGADNDCDGEVDYGEEIRDTDILFIVDWSGSMDEEIAAVRVALNQFAQQFAAEEALQWGLVVGPKEPGERYEGPELLVKVSDIAPFDRFLQSFSQLGNEGMDTGSEMLKDAIYLAIQNITGSAGINVEEVQWRTGVESIPEKEEFRITWRENSDRIIILFSDEEPQSFWTPPTISEILLPALRAAVGLKMYGFVSAGWQGNEWEDYILAGNGRRLLLTTNANNMYNDLMSIIDEACLPNNDPPVREASKSFYNPMYRYYDFRRQYCSDSRVNSL